MNRRDFIKTAVGTVAALPAATTLASDETENLEQDPEYWSHEMIVVGTWDMRAGYGTCPEVLQYRRWDVLTRVVGMIDEHLPMLTPNHRAHVVKWLFEVYSEYMEKPELRRQKNFSGIDTYIFVLEEESPSRYCIQVKERYTNYEKTSEVEFEGETIKLDYQLGFIMSDQYAGNCQQDAEPCPEWEKICEQHAQARMFNTGREFGEDLFEET